MLALAAFWWKAQPVNDDLLDRRTLEALDQLLAKTRFTLFPFLPSYWLSSSVLQWAEGVLRGAAFFALVLLSHTLFFGGIAFTRFGRLFYDTASAVQSRAGSGWNWFRARPDRRYSVGALEKIVAKLSWLDRDTRALAVKDLRMFWRDTTQWGQSVMLFGLLGVYIINLRNFTHQLSSPFWVNLVAFLNLGVCSLNLASVTTRFVFPQFSLEGWRLWIIGMAPMGMARVVKIKFWLASILSLFVTFGLIMLSCYLLKTSWDRVLFFGAVIAVMTFALNGLAIGLGVLYPNLKEANPNKIVSGFGGTPVFRAEFVLHPGVRVVADVRRGRLALARQLGGGRHRRLCAAVRWHRLAAAEIGAAAIEKFRDVISSPVRRSPNEFAIDLERGTVPGSIGGAVRNCSPGSRRSERRSEPASERGFIRQRCEPCVKRRIVPAANFSSASNNNGALATCAALPSRASKPKPSP